MPVQATDRPSLRSSCDRLRPGRDVAAVAVDEDHAARPAAGRAAELDQQQPQRLVADRDACPRTPRARRWRRSPSARATTTGRPGVQPLGHRTGDRRRRSSCRCRAAGAGRAAPVEPTGTSSSGGASASGGHRSWASASWAGPGIASPGDRQRLRPRQRALVAGAGRPAGQQRQRHRLVADRAGVGVVLRGGRALARGRPRERAARRSPCTHSGSGPSSGRPVKNFAAMQPPRQESKKPSTSRRRRRSAGERSSGNSSESCHTAAKPPSARHVAGQEAVVDRERAGVDVADRVDQADHAAGAAEVEARAGPRRTPRGGRTSRR